MKSCADRSWTRRKGRLGLVLRLWGGVVRMASMEETRWEELMAETQLTARHHDFPE